LPFVVYGGFDVTTSGGIRFLEIAGRKRKSEDVE
jgi:hypothetical protein